MAWLGEWGPWIVAAMAGLWLVLLTRSWLLGALWQLACGLLVAHGGASVLETITAAPTALPTDPKHRADFSVDEYTLVTAVIALTVAAVQHRRGIATMRTPILVVSSMAVVARVIAGSSTGLGAAIAMAVAATGVLVAVALGHGTRYLWRRAHREQRFDPSPPKVSGREAVMVIAATVVSRRLRRLVTRWTTA